MLITMIVEQLGKGLLELADPDAGTGGYVAVAGDVDGASVTEAGLQPQDEPVRPA
jgi:hypothetical protein